MKEKLKRTKLLVVVLAPIITAMLVIISKQFNLPFTEDQLTTIAGGLILLALGYQHSQGKVDVEREKTTRDIVRSEFSDKVPAIDRRSHKS